MRSPMRSVTGTIDSIFEGYPAPTLIVDRDVRVLMANRAARDMLGEEPVTVPLSLGGAGDVLHCLHALGPGGCGRQEFCDDCVIRRSVDHAFTTGAVQRARAFARVRQGGRDVDACLLVSASLIQHEGDARVVLTLEDVTELMRVDAALQASEERYRSIFEASGDAILAIDADGRFTEANPSALKMLGYAREELLELRYQQITPERWRAMNETILREQVPTRGYSDTYEKEYVRKDGTIVPVSVRAFVRRDGAGHPVGAWAIVRDITERKRSEHARRMSERLLAEIVERAPAFMCVLRGPAHVFELANEQYFQVVGRRDIIGKKLVEALPEVAATPYPRILDRVFQTGEPFTATGVSLLLPRGPSGRAEEACLDFVYLPLRGPDGAITGIFVHGVDMTEPRRAQEALRYERDLNRSVTEYAAEAIFVTDEAGRIVFSNREAERVFGFTREELAGRVLHDAIHHHDADGRPYPRSACPRTAAYESGETLRERPDVFFRKDGAAVRVLCSSAPLELSGKRIGGVLIARDVTQLAQAEEALRESEKRFRALIENSTDIIVVLDAEARYRFWSPSATEALGWTPEEVMGRTAFEFLHPDDRKRISEAFVSLLATEGATARIPVRHRHKGGSWRELEAFARNLLHTPAVNGVLVNSRDVTEQHRLEEQLRQAQKLESIGRLAGGVAHDFNNLLTVILSGAETLRQDSHKRLPSDPEVVEDIGAAGRRARDLARQLLAIARRQVIAPIPFDLSTLLRGSETLLRRVLGEDVELVSKLEPRLWPVRCDPGQIEQVILNLAVNARDAMPDGGSLTIEASNVDVDQRLVDVHPWMLPGAYVRLSIRDSGHGMSPEVKAHLFEPFYTTKPVGRGTGLGLATVYGIVKQNEGFILADSEEGEGTAFQLYFPRIAEAAVATAVSSPAAALGGTETVLVVEDDPQIRKIAARVLMGAGYRVFVAGNGEQALDVGARAELHLLLTDVVMPGLDGRAVAEALRRRRPELRVLFVSGHPEEVIARRGVLEPSVAFLAKPFTPSSLLARVRSVLDEPDP